MTDIYDRAKAHIRNQRRDTVQDCCDFARAVVLLADDRDALQGLVERITLEAQMHASEARCQRTTVQEVGQQLSDNGSVPDWGPIVVGVRTLRERAERAEERIARAKAVAPAIEFDVCALTPVGAANAMRTELLAALAEPTSPVPEDDNNERETE